MRLDRFEVTNHSRIVNLRLDLRSHAVIIGANDVGKSSILRMLHLLLGSTTAQLYQQLSLADLADPSEHLAAEARLVDFTDAERSLFPREISIDPDDKNESLRVRLEAGVDSDDDQAITIRRWFPEAGHDRGPSREQLVGFGWRYLPATRSATAASLDGPSSALQTLLKAIELGAERTVLAGLLDDFNTQLGKNDRITRLRSDVASHLSKAMPRSMGQDDLSVRTATDPGEDVLGGVSMFLERDGEHVPLADQSDGLRALMSMTMFDLAEGAANIVAIDEPELHLHATSQRTVAELFRSASNQKILATHSPYIVHRFEPSEVIAISPDGGCHQIAPEQVSKLEKARAHWWSPRLLESLTARHAIIVEGAADRIVVEGVAQAMGMSLDRLGAVVLDIDGAEKFPHVYKLIGAPGFGVSVLGLVDDAQKNVWLGQIGGKPATVLGSTLWVSTPDLEGEYCRAFTGPDAARALIASGFCREAAVLASCDVQSLDDIAAEQVAAYCRKAKVDAAVAVSSQLDLAMAMRIASVFGLLDKLRSLGAA